MDSKNLSPFSSSSSILNASIAKHLFLRSLLLAAAISIVSLLHSLPNLSLDSLSPKTHTNNNNCLSPQNATLSPGSYLFQSRVFNTFWGSFESLTECEKGANFTIGVVNDLMGMGVLGFGDRSLCVGQGSVVAVSAMEEMGFKSVSGVHDNGLFNSIKQKGIVCQLKYQDCSFDFVFSKDVDKVPVPASLVLEVERILKPGGIAALIVGPTGDLVSSADKVSSLLRSSSIVHVGHVNDHTLVVFKKRFESRSFSFTKPLVKLMEPLVEEEKTPIQEHEKRISYLPKVLDISNRKRLVFIDVGLRENVTDDLFLPSNYPIDHNDFSVYFVHYNTSIFLSHVKQPGFTFVYHPGLLSEKVATAAEDGVAGGGEEFDFLAWFKETAKHADFVVLKMHAGNVEMKFLEDIIENGAISFVDEMFLSCSESKKTCMNIYKGLRDNGIYVHQWWETGSRQESQTLRR